MTTVLRILGSISLLSTLILAGCGDSASSVQASRGSGAIERPRDTSAVPVTVAKVERSTIPVQLHAIGAGQAFKTVSVESQVAGIVKEVNYKQGLFVHEGDLLLTLDKRPFIAALDQSTAALSRDNAQAQLDRAQLERYEGLYKEGIVSKEQFEQYRATSTAAEATVNFDEAAIQTAKIQLSYCSIYAPISGVTGARCEFIRPAVKANDLPVLVVINQVSPIYVSFSVPQQYLESVKNFMMRSRLPVQATPTGDSKPEIGTLTFVDNTVDPATGTIALRASFPNNDQHLWPGQFSNVLLQLGEQQNVLVVPSHSGSGRTAGGLCLRHKPGYDR